MTTIDKYGPPSENEVESFIMNTGFTLPSGFIDFYKGTNGAEISSEEKYISLWALTDMIQLNKEYKVDEYASEFFIFGSDGGGTAYVIERNTGDIYEVPFVGMSRKEAVFRNKRFMEFIEKI